MTVNHSVQFEYYEMKASAKSFEEIVKLILGEKVKPDIQSTYRFPRIMKGLELSSMRKINGKNCCSH